MFIVDVWCEEFCVMRMLVIDLVEFCFFVNIDLDWLIMMVLYEE